MLLLRNSVFLTPYTLHIASGFFFFSFLTKSFYTLLFNMPCCKFISSKVLGFGGPTIIRNFPECLVIFGTDYGWRMGWEAGQKFELTGWVWSCLVISLSWFFFWVFPLGPQGGVFQSLACRARIMLPLLWEPGCGRRFRTSAFSISTGHVTLISACSGWYLCSQHA